MKVYGLPSGQGLDRRNDMDRTAGEGHNIPAVQALAEGSAQTFIVPEAKVSVAFSALNSCSAVSR